MRRSSPIWDRARTSPTWDYEEDVAAVRERHGGSPERVISEAAVDASCSFCNTANLLVSIVEFPDGATAAYVRDPCGPTYHFEGTSSFDTYMNLVAKAETHK